MELYYLCAGAWAVAAAQLNSISIESPLMDLNSVIRRAGLLTIILCLFLLRIIAIGLDKEWLCVFVCEIDSYLKCGHAGCVLVSVLCEATLTERWTWRLCEGHCQKWATPHWGTHWNTRPLPCWPQTGTWRLSPADNEHLHQAPEGSAGCHSYGARSHRPQTWGLWGSPGLDLVTSSTCKISVVTNKDPQIHSDAELSFLSVSLSYGLMLLFSHNHVSKILTYVKSFFHNNVSIQKPPAASPKREAWHLFLKSLGLIPMFLSLLRV